MTVTNRGLHPQVTLVGVENRWSVGVEGALQLHDGVVDGWLKFNVFRIHHQPHIALHAQNTHPSGALHALAACCSTLLQRHLNSSEQAR